ncbi:MAG: hypothetical protein IIU38_09680 [Bacteroidaceae bacterium]|nr:hypothetical protein [Bacteroidaceae bacterium]
MDKQKYWKISNTSENLQDSDSGLVERIAVAVAKYDIKNKFDINPATTIEKRE